MKQTKPSQLSVEIVPNAAPALVNRPSNLPVIDPGNRSQRDIASLWLQSKDADLAAGIGKPLTVKNYRRHVARFLDFLDAHEITTPASRDVMAWMGELHGSKLSPGSIATMVSSISSLYGWTETAGLYPHIARGIKKPNTRKDEPMDCLAPKDVASLIGMVEGGAMLALRNRALVHVLFATACRCTSIHHANVEDYDTEAAALIYQGKGDTEKKKKKHLSRDAEEALVGYLEAREKAEGKLAPDAPLFTAHDNANAGARLTTRSIGRVVSRLMESAGHVSRGSKGRIRRPGTWAAHSLRRSAITAAADHAGMDAARDLADHADRRTTERHYARVKKGRVLRELAHTLNLSDLVASDAA